MTYYVLDTDGRTPIPIDDVVAWGIWFQYFPNRVVAKTEIPGGVVSTVFLGLDHNFGGGRPLLWETMVFIDGGSDDLAMRRWSTYDEAAAGHAEIVDLYDPRSRPERQPLKQRDERQE